MFRITIQYGAPADPQAFDSYYAEKHRPLVAALPGLRSFTTSKPRGLGEDVDLYLVAELWFDDAEALKTVLRSPEMAAAGADASTFDVASMTMFTGEVVTVLPAAD